MESDCVKNKEMIERVQTEYTRRVWKILKSKLNGGNMVKAINTWAVPVIRYTAGVLKWTKEQMRELDRKTRKLLTMYGGLHPKADTDRLYVHRTEGGRGLKGIEDTIAEEEHGLWKYISSHDEFQYREMRKVLQDSGSQDISEYKAGKAKEKMTNWKQKAMHGQYLRQTEGFRAQETWQWLKRGTLKRETEALIVAAQDQALRTNYRKAKIEKNACSSLCRMCKERDETVSHIVSECPKLAQTEYKGRHDRVAAAVHWSLCKKHKLETSDRWYKHRAEKVLENEQVKILWDFSVQTDKLIHARRPDIIVVDKTNSTCQLIDIAVPGDTRTYDKETEKIEKYQELAREIKRLWKLHSVTVVPVIIGALGTISKAHLSYLATLNVHLSFETIQKSAILGSATILRKVLES